MVSLFPPLYEHVIILKSKGCLNENNIIFRLSKRMNYEEMKAYLVSMDRRIGIIS